MAMRPGRRAFGAEQVRITLRTSCDGLAAQAGDDLTIDVDRRAGTGGVKPLTDRDRREIAVTARKVLHVAPAENSEPGG